MKIIIVSPYLYPYLGGLENYAFSIAKRLNKNYKWNIIFITSSDRRLEKNIEIIDGIKIYKLPRWFKISNTPINPLWYLDIKKIISKEKPDLINAHTPVPFISDMSNRAKGQTPFILTYHSDLVKVGFIKNFICKLTYKLLINKTLKNSDLIIATSSEYVNKSKYLNNLKSNCRIVSPGVDLSIFNSKGNKKEFKKKYHNKKIIIFVGQLDRSHSHKGLSNLILAVKTIDQKKVQLIVVGEGNAINYYKDFANSLRVENITFSGALSNKKLASYYRSADLLVLPSVNDSEGFGMVILEAGACGTPSIASDVGGVSAAIINGKTGILIEPNNVNALANQINKLLDNDTLRKNMGKAAEKLIENEFNWETKTKETELIYKALLRSEK